MIKEKKKNKRIQFMIIESKFEINLFFFLKNLFFAYN
jgi:hypothetical protein